MTRTAAKADRARQGPGAGVRALVLLSAIAFSLSVVPGVLGQGTLSAYGWRLAMLGMALAMATHRRRLWISPGILGLLLPYMMLASIAALLGIEGQSDLAAKIALLAMAVAVTTPRPADGPAAAGIVVQFLRQSMVLTTLFTLVLLWNVLDRGWTWEAARLLKSEMMGFIPFNTSLFFMVVVLTVAPFADRRMNLGMMGLFVAISLISGTRTPAIALSVALILGLPAARLAAHGRLARQLVILSLVIATGVLIAWAAQSDSAEVNRFLAGRQALWVAGFAQWTAAPLLGHAESTVAEAVSAAYSDLAFSFEWEFGALTDLQSGGFHNLWIETLVSHGLVGLVVVVAGFWILLNRALASGRIRPLVFVLILVVRGCLEVGSGLYSNGASPTEYPVHLVCAMILADRARTRLPSAAGRPARPLAPVAA